MGSNNTEKIRLLVISDLYPPYHRGGYELVAEMTNKRLAGYGFQVRVLTSDYKINKKTNVGEVRRIFDYDFGKKACFPKSLYLQIVNLRRLRREIEGFKPQLISVWHPTFLSKTVLDHVHSLNIPVVYNLSDSWPIWWYYNEERNSWFGYFQPGKSRIKNAVKAVLKGICAPFVPVDWKPVNFPSAFFVSNTLKQMYLDKNLPLGPRPVIYPGLPLEEYPMAPKPRTDQNTFRIIWTGRIAEYKGTHIALEAVSALVNRLNIKNLSLSVFGEAEDKAYRNRLLRIIRTNGLEQYVEFKGLLSYAEVIREYQKHDICLFTSIYKEPFGLVWLEAMASGVPVIGTVTGASQEIFIDHENALIYKEQDPDDLAGKIAALMGDPGLYAKIQDSALKLVKEKFDIKFSVERIAEYYKSILTCANTQE